ncbi:glycosyltransferase, putative [Sulfolobus islandicus M.16.4]|uniref:Glycosyltransferase, putative n=1 Tax=Saccharolobus islandicus (strain M.16.4 / Kamchatka \|nr:glycosyltransferase, putative [Sulfolobus islandicus M.16.4]
MLHKFYNLKNIIILFKCKAIYFVDIPSMLFFLPLYFTLKLLRRKIIFGLHGFIQRIIALKGKYLGI